MVLSLFDGKVGRDHSRSEVLLVAAIRSNSSSVKTVKRMWKQRILSRQLYYHDHYSAFSYTLNLIAKHACTIYQGIPNFMSWCHFNSPFTIFREEYSTEKNSVFCIDVYNPNSEPEVNLNFNTHMVASDKVSDTFKPLPFNLLRRK